MNEARFAMFEPIRMGTLNSLNTKGDVYFQRIWGFNKGIVEKPPTNCRIGKKYKALGLFSQLLRYLPKG